MIFNDKKIVSDISSLNERLDRLEAKIDALMAIWDVDADAPTKEPQEEEWRVIMHNGLATELEVSTFGNVRKAHDHTPIKPHRNKTGKPRVNIYWYEDGVLKTSTALVENIVARAFLEPFLPLKSSSVRHIDRDLDNNRLDNLYIQHTK